MKVTLESTSRIVAISESTSQAVPVQARVWEGVTDSGIPVVALITRIAVHKDHDATQFEVELREQKTPTLAGIEAFPLRLII